MLFNIVKIVLTVVEILVCVLLITAILIQKSKTQGAGLAFGAGVGETLFGGQIGNVMTKVTVILAVVFLVNTTALTYLAVKGKYRRPVATKRVEPGPAPDASTVPAAPGADMLPPVDPVDGGNELPPEPSE